MALNLHNIVRGAITSVVQDIVAQFQRSLGNTVTASGKQVPQYAPKVPVRIQSQALTGGQIRHVEFLNLQGVFRSVYMYGDTQGIMRVNQQGGDLLTFSLVPGAPPQVWKVVEVSETWPDWCKVIVCLQTDLPT